MNQSEPAFPSFRSAYLWVKKQGQPMMVAPSTELSGNLKDSVVHRLKAWKLFYLITEMVINRGWSLLAIPNGDSGRFTVSALTHDKQKDWLVSISSTNQFAELDAQTFNYGIKVSVDPAKNMVASLGKIPAKPSSDISDEDVELDLWYDDDGDFLYGPDQGNIKDTLKSFLSNLGDDPNIFVVKVNLPTDTNIKAINWFFKAFGTRQ